MTFLKVAIVGSRDFGIDDTLPSAGMDKLIKSLVAEMDNEDYVVSGGATGADTWGEYYARFYNVGRIVHAAHWEKHGKAAGHIRNALIVKDADVLFAFYTDRTTSRGTLNCVSKARKKGIDVYEYDAKTNRWYVNDALAPECFDMDYKAAITRHRD